MINTMKMYEELSETMDSKSAKKIVEMMSYMYEEIQNTVTKTEFNELKDIVKDLSIKVGELTTGQKALAEAQKRTEDKVTELAETLTKLVKEHDDTKRQMGGIAQSIGYNLEDKAYKALPALLKRDFNITIEGRLIRDYVKDNKEREFEVNIFGKGKRGGKDIIIIGESKTVLSENDIKSFIRKRIETLKDVFKEEIFPVLVTRSVSNSKVKEFAKSVNLHIYYSYDF